MSRQPCPPPPADGGGCFIAGFWAERDALLALFGRAAITSRPILHPSSARTSGLHSWLQAIPTHTSCVGMYMTCQGLSAGRRWCMGCLDTGPSQQELSDGQQRRPGRGFAVLRPETNDGTQSIACGRHAQHPHGLLEHKWDGPLNHSV